MLYTDWCLDITLLHLAWFSFQISQHCKFALHPLQNNKSGNPARLIHWTSLPCWTTDTLTKIIQIHSSLICVKQCFCLKVEFWWNVLLHYTGSSFPPMIILLIMCYYSIRPIYMPAQPSQWPPYEQYLILIGAAHLKIKLLRGRKTKTKISDDLVWEKGLFCLFIDDENSWEFFWTKLKKKLHLAGNAISSGSSADPLCGAS